jgi:hypothetical protein
VKNRFHGERWGAESDLQVQELTLDAYRFSLGAEGGSKQELGRFSQHCARGREPFSSGEKFGETASLHFDRQLSRTLQIALTRRAPSRTT